MKTFTALVATLTCCTCSIAAEPIRILAWNIESGRSDTAVIIDQLKTQMPNYDIVALSEVPSNAIERIAKALNWKYFGGSRGGEDRLMFAWSSRFNVKLQRELRNVGDAEFPGGNNRAPLYIQLQDTQTSKDIIVMNNHLTRGKEKNRNKQAELLVDWVRNIRDPVFAVGDYNMDYEFKTRKGNAAFDLIQKNGHWKWIEPMELIDTNWADPDGDGNDNYPDSMLDFVFVNAAAQDLKVKCEVIVRDRDFPDNEKTSDHRPVLTTVDW